MFKTELQRTGDVHQHRCDQLKEQPDALMFLKKIFSKHETVPMSADDIVSCLAALDLIDAPIVLV